MKTFSIILTILGLYFFVYACAEKPCTDDGCPEFTELNVSANEVQTNVVQVSTELQDIEEWHPDIMPNVLTGTKDQFVYTLCECIDHVYKTTPVDRQIPKELIIAQAVIETGWGTSRFANEGNNLFGIRTFNKDDEWLLPITWDQNKWIGWGVKVYKTRCDSVKRLCTNT